MPVAPPPQPDARMPVAPTPTRGPETPPLARGPQVARADPRSYSSAGDPYVGRSMLLTSPRHPATARQTFSLRAHPRPRAPSRLRHSHSQTAASADPRSQVRTTPTNTIRPRRPAPTPPTPRPPTPSRPYPQMIRPADAVVLTTRTKFGTSRRSGVSQKKLLVTPARHLPALATGDWRLSARPTPSAPCCPPARERGAAR